MTRLVVATSRCCSPPGVLVPAPLLVARAWGPRARPAVGGRACVDPDTRCRTAGAGATLLFRLQENIVPIIFFHLAS